MGICVCSPISHHNFVKWGPLVTKLYMELDGRRPIYQMVPGNIKQEHYNNYNVIMSCYVLFSDDTANHADKYLTGTGITVILVKTCMHMHCRATIIHSFYT